MGTKPMISVIIPAYNAEQTLERACRSVWNQTYPNVELVVVDDGSTDGTPQLLDSLAAGREQVQAIHQKNGGVCSARNTGLDRAKGDFLCFLDADDELTPRALESLYEIMEKTQSQIAAGPCTRVRPDGTSFESLYPITGEQCLWRGLEPLEQSLKDHPATYSVWGKLYRREIIGDIRFVEGRKIHEDSFFLFQVLQQKLNMVVTNTSILRYYLTQGSASRGAFSGKFLDILYFAQEKSRIVQENHPQYGNLAKNVEIKACLSLLNKMRAGCPKEYLPVQKQCLETVRENARYFVPALPVDRVTFAAVRLHLFWLYKWVYRLLKR